MEDLIRRGLARPSGAKVIVSAVEAEHMIKELKAFPPSEVGSSQWMLQHDSIERLNMQAHQSAQRHTDEFVLEALLSHNRLVVLVRELLAAEVWKEKVLPHLAAHLSSSVDSVTAYQLLYHEAVVANLLEVCLYHQHACEALPDDALLELCDWCYRKLVQLNTTDFAREPSSQESAQHLLADSLQQEQAERAREIDFGTSLCALTIVRYLIDNVSSLPLGMTTRLTSTNDVLMALLPLLERPPWTRRVDKQEQRYSNGAWHALAPADCPKLSQYDAQVWLALLNLVVDPGCRGHALASAHRCEALLRARRHISDALLDQLPPLRELRRALDELALGVSSCAPDQAAPCHLIIEQVPVLREALLRCGDWAAVAARQKRDFFGPQSRALAQSRAGSLLEAFELMCAMQPDTAGGTEDEQAQVTAAEGCVKCQFWRHIKDDLYEDWANMSFSVDWSKAAEEVEVCGDSTCCVRGRRQRLQEVPMASSKPLPCFGKVIARYRGSTAEARIKVPAPSTRTACAGELPAVGWLTVGLLAADGFALQLRLQRADHPALRDIGSGTWLAYHAVGGAVTILTSGNGKSQLAPATGPLAF